MLAQIAADPGSSLANLGASGAIAAAMGAFLITYPRDRIRTVLTFGLFLRIPSYGLAYQLNSGS